MYIEAFILPLIIGKLRGGEFRKLLDIYINKWWLITIAGLIEFIATIINNQQIDPISQWINHSVLWLHLITYTLLMITIIYNIQEKGFIFILIGILLNFVVIMLNGGKMPVDISNINHLISEDNLLRLSQDLTHTLANDSTKLNFLGDIIHLNKPYPFPKSLSIGDFFLIAGLFRFIHDKMLH